MKRLFAILKILVIVLIIDGLILGMPGAITFAIGKDYLGQEPGFSIIRFLQMTIFTALTYSYKAFPFYLFGATIYVLIFRYLTITLMNCLLVGVVLALALYLIYAYIWSLNSEEGDFLWKATLKLFIGGLFSYLYFKNSRRYENSGHIGNTTL